MSKQGEINYLKKLGKEGIKETINKPFAKNCGRDLVQIGLVISLLPLPPAKLLDLGCGVGWTSIFFAKRGYEVTGLDISEGMIYQANLNKKREKIKNVRFIVGDYENVHLDDKFDCVVFYDALHHALNEEAAVRLAYNLLKPGGICVTAEPGVGHEKSPEAIEAVKKYDVTEKDMPPAKIIGIGKKVGFKMFKIYPHANDLISIFEMFAYSKDVNKGIEEETNELFYKKKFERYLFLLKNLKILVKALWKIYFKKYLGTVVMVK